MLYIYKRIESKQTMIFSMKNDNNQDRRTLHEPLAPWICSSRQMARVLVSQLSAKFKKP